MPRFPAILIAPILAGMLLACNPSDSGQSANQQSGVTIGGSSSVRVNGKPVARITGGDHAGGALLAADCAAAGSLETSSDVRINGAPARVLKPGATAADCQLIPGSGASANVKIGG